MNGIKIFAYELKIAILPSSSGGKNAVTIGVDIRDIKQLIHDAKENPITLLMNVLEETPIVIT